MLRVEIFENKLLIFSLSKFVLKEISRFFLISYFEDYWTIDYPIFR